MTTGNTIDAGCRLSPLQEGILFDSINANRPGMYFEQAIWTIRGPLDATCLRRAWQLVSDRHETLRTRFVWEGRDRPHQEILDAVEISWRQLDWDSIPPDRRDAALEEWLTEDRLAGFALSIEPPLRVTLIRLGAALHHLALSSHHVLLDRWSVGIILSEVVAAYEALRRGSTPVFPPARPYRDYIDWIERQDAGSAMPFWRELLKGISGPTSLASFCRPALTQPADLPASENEDALCSESTTASLRAMARARRLTLNTVVQGAWALVLSRYAGSEDVVYGLVVNGRPPALAGVTAIVGLFINTLPMRVRVSASEPIVTLLERLQRVQLQIDRFSHSSLVDVKSAAGLEGTAALFDTLYVFQNLPGASGARAPAGDLRIESSGARSDTNYPLVLLAVPGDRLMLRLKYDPARVPTAVARRMVRHLQEVLAAFAADAGAPLGRVGLLAPDERARMLVEWNDTASAPADRCLHELVAEQAQVRPGARAVVCGSRALTYAQLEEKANRLAVHLRSRGVGAETPVVVFMGRTLGLLPALLGILKAGGTYVPVDAATPRERAAAIVGDCGATLVVTDAASLAAARRLPCEPVNVDDLINGSVASTAGVSQVASLEQAAYVMYTSGSTGRPKGVVVSHRGLSNYLKWCLANYPVASGRGALVASSIAFDLTITGLFAPLIAGCEVWLVADEDAVEGMAWLLRSGGFSTVKLTPAHLDALGSLLGLSGANGARAFVIGGEALRAETAAGWRRLAPATALFNEYGPTETVVGCCVHQVIDSDCVAGADVPIGRPIANTRLYVLDTHLQPVPLGVPGELYVGGSGVARGYLRQPAMTAAAFVADPFSDVPGQRLYRTGDLVKHREDGILEFLGRRDEQIKIRGFRVELGEVASVLRGHPAVADAVALADDLVPGDTQIVAYVAGPRVPGVEIDLTPYLRERLPEYMVPSKIIWLQQLPLTPNGKIDRRALPALRRAGSGERPHTPPRSAAEAKLAAIWADLLRLDRVGIDENFFDLGGHSLRIFQLAARVQAAFGVKLPMRAYFDAPTIAEQTAVIARKLDEIAAVGGPTDAAVAPGRARS